MTTLNDIVASVSDQLSRSDLEQQIIREVGLAVSRYSRRLTYLTEVRAGVVVLDPRQTWYSDFRLTSAAGLQNMQDRGLVPFSNVVSFDFVRYASVDVLSALLLENDEALLLEDPDVIALALERGMQNPDSVALTTELCRLHHREFEQWDSDYTPVYRFGYSFYAGQFGVRPDHFGAAIYFSGHVKPQIPNVGTDTSVFFDQARELIEAAAAGAVCVKYIQDADRAAAFGILEARELQDIELETNRKSATGRLAANW